MTPAASTSPINAKNTVAPLLPQQQHNLQVQHRFPQVPDIFFYLENHTDNEII